MDEFPMCVCVSVYIKSCIEPLYIYLLINVILFNQVYIMFYVMVT